MAEAHRIAAQIDQGARFTLDGILGALLKLAEQRQQEVENLQAAFARVVRETETGRQLYSAFCEPLDGVSARSSERCTLPVIRVDLDSIGL
jgi:hypothetical protein